LPPASETWTENEPLAVSPAGDTPIFSEILTRSLKLPDSSKSTSAKVARYWLPATCVQAPNPDVE
jgi:hypothetical protein